MTVEEYKTKQLELDQEFETKKQQLAKEYAVSNNPYKIGDIISDHAVTIQIEKMNWGYGYDKTPSYMIYHGLELKKDGTPKKNHPKAKIYQSNIIVK